MRLPAPRCTACDTTPGPDTGQRITIAYAGGVTLASSTASIPVLANVRPRELRLLRLEGRYRDAYVVLWGECWMDAGCARAREQAQGGLLPWICQRCAGRICRQCGAPERHPLGTSVVSAEGRKTYMPRLPIGDLGCTNPACPAGPNATR